MVVVFELLSLEDLLTTTTRLLLSVLVFVFLFVILLLFVELLVTGELLFLVVVVEVARVEPVSSIIVLLPILREVVVGCLFAVISELLVVVFLEFAVLTILLYALLYEVLLP